MIKELETFVNKINDDLLNRINELQKIRETNEQIIAIIDSIINGNNLDAEQLAIITDFHNHNKYSDIDNKKIYFILNVILKHNMQLDDSQVEALKKLKDNIIADLNFDSLKELKANIENNKDLIEKLKSDNIFNSFDELNDFFEKYNYDLRKRLDILMHLIKHNDKLITEKLTVKKTIEEVLTSFNINLNDAKEVIEVLKQRDVNEISDILQRLDSLSEVTKPVSIFKKNKQLFSRILLYSSLDVINAIERISREESIDLDELLSSQINVLIPSARQNNIPRMISNTSSVIGQFHNFVNNVLFFKSKGLNISDVFKKCSSVLVKSSNLIMKNYEILTNLYGIDMSDGKSLTALLNSQAISNLDRFIEISDCGYEYIKSNRSKLLNTEEKDLYKIKISEVYASDPNVQMRVSENGKFSLPGTKAIYRQPNGKLVKSNSVMQDGSNDVNTLRSILGISDIEEINTNEFVFDNQETINEDVYNISYIRDLENNYKFDNYTYIINNVRVSRIKVLRIISCCLDNNIPISENEILFAIKFKSILTDTELKIINSFRFMSQIYTGGFKLE